MKTENHIKTYGIRSGMYKGKERVFVVCDGRITGLHFAKASFALKKARHFVQNVYRPFIRKIGNEETQITYTYLLE